MLLRSEVCKHASRQSCWVIINGIVYDLTSFLDSHPGGANIILKYAGQDATTAFESIHASDALEKYLTPEQNLGSVSGPVVAIKKKTLPDSEGNAKVDEGKKKPRLGSIINIRDFELAAAQLLSPRSFAFFKAGADDEYTAQWNRDSWKAIRFRPRVLRPVISIDTSTSILGNKFSAPFFIAPAGGGKLAHPTGEVLMTKAAGQHGILHWVCNNAGCSQRQMTDARIPSQVAYWQIYAVSNLSITEKEIKQAVAQGYKGLALTVDAIRPGKRERDVRMGIEDDDSDDDEGESFANEPTVKRPTVTVDFDWISAIKWLRSISDLPIAIKGIQSWEDARLCMLHGVHPWLSNHAGRQLDGAPSAADTLVSIRRHCPEVFDRCEVIVDGGIMRGTDIVKALALGAKAVGLGRSFLYALTFGEKGVSKAIRILKHEVETAMALLGVTEISQLNPSYVDSSALIYASAIPRAHL